MSESKTNLRKIGVGLACLIEISFIAGCALVPPQSFLDPTKVGMFPMEYREGGIRRVLTPREGPIGLANAVEPTPEDLIVNYEEYRLGRLDQVGVLINDLLVSGVPYQAALEVNSSGYIRIPQLGMMQVLGMSERELEHEIATRLQSEGILTNPIVQVFITAKRYHFFNVIGSVSRPGSYNLIQPDTRLLDVLGIVGDIGPLSKRAYIIRRTEPGEVVVPETPALESQDDGLIIPPPSDGDAFENAFFVNDAGGFQDPPEPESDQTAEAEAELESVIAPPSRQVDKPAAQEGERTDRKFSPLVFDPVTGQLKEVDETDPVVSEARIEEPDAYEREEFDWEEVPEYEFSQRVIEIDVPALKAGDPRYNVVIRPRDLINIPVDTGVYYVMGEVARPGVYTLGGREITIKQAIASVGGFGRLAWPSRCEIVRREKGTDKQITIPVNLDHVFAGLEDDILLRDDDLINVGTDFIAPFLFVIRNSFRFTYGFGFVYDRNFADKDAYSSQINPETLEIQRRQQLGLPF